MTTVSPLTPSTSRHKFSWVKFILVAGCAALIHYTIWRTFSFRLGSPVVWANLIGLVITFSVSYLGHLWFSFGESPLTPLTQAEAQKLTRSLSDNPYSSPYDSLDVLADTDPAWKRMAQWGAVLVLASALQHLIFLVTSKFLPADLLSVCWVFATVIMVVALYVGGNRWAFK